LKISIFTVRQVVGKSKSPYEQARDNWYLDRLLDGPTDDFIARYKDNHRKRKEHKTIFFFPGGMASQMIRAQEKYPQFPPLSYDTIWLNCSVLDGVVINLQMQNHGQEDYQQRFVVPDGCIDFVDLEPYINLRPYRGFIRWCQTNHLDLFVFGWDWRRESQATADFFLKQFLPKFKSRVKECPTPPLKNFWIIGHSFGGMVIKHIMNDYRDGYVQEMKGAITVASPFYGSGGQLPRYFKGFSYVNGTVGSHGARKITKAISTMPGGYELLFLDGATYDANRAKFANDPDPHLSLTSYPSMDVNETERADPYNPIDSPLNKKVRYISSCGFDRKMLDLGKLALADLARPLNDTVAGKFWNIRGFGKRTVVGQTWERVFKSFDPDADRNPIRDKHGAGDTVVPAWSARLLGNPNVVNVEVETEHTNMMNERAVKLAITDRLEQASSALRRRMRNTAKTTKLKAASRKKLNEFLRGLQAVTTKKGLRPKARKVAIRRYLGKYSPSQLEGFLTRAYLDALKSPSQISD
jgi:pimeloyl-ACP methyl ester carboxylesterase